MVRWSHHFKVHIRTGTKEKIIITHTGIPFEGVQVYNLQGLMRKIYLSHDSFADQQAKADLSQSNSPLSAFSLFLLLPVSERVDYSTSPPDQRKILFPPPPLHPSQGAREDTARRTRS
jgi:hypothetical protein